MKILLYTAFLFCLLMACKPNSTKSEKAEDTPVTLSTADVPTNSLLHILGDTLVAMEIVDEESNDPYQKYGFEFAGNCYDCDVANIIITSNNLTLVNACETGDIKEIDTKMIANTGDKMTVSMDGSAKFIFERVEEIPVFKLTIEGNLKQEKNLRPAIYYTSKKVLSRFKVCDCGDFQG